MELRHLRSFRAVAEELHFGRAAAKLHIAQPPLSQQIRALEKDLGVTLFARSTRRVELTPAGEDYLKRVVTILGDVDHAADRARRIAAGFEGRLVVGCVGSATYTILPRFVRALRDELPYVEVSIRGEMLAPAQLEALADRQIDLALLRRTVPCWGVNFETLRRDRLIVALPQGHSFAGRDHLELADLSDQDFIAHAGAGRSVMSGIVTTICAAAGFGPRIRHEVSETSTLVTLVAAGLGIAIVPEPTAAIGVTGVQYRPLNPSALGVDLEAAWLPDAVSSVIERSRAVLRGIVAS